MSRHTPFFELRTAIGAPGCPICALTLQALERYLRGVVYESVNDVRVRQELRATFGLCAAHGTMLREARSALGTAIIERDMLRAAAAQLSQIGPAGSNGWRSALFGKRTFGRDAPLAPRGPCLACSLAEKTERDLVVLLLQHYDELRPEFQLSTGVCLAHLRLGLALAGPDVLPHLRDDQLAIWGRLEAELDEFIRKQDHNFTGEVAGAENDSWSRALDLISGSWRVTGNNRAPE
jgi:hypothetical protein